MTPAAIVGIGATEFSKDSGRTELRLAAEAVRQIRGTAVNQVPGDAPVLVTAGTGVPTRALVLC